ncbi:PH domain-containing protein [Raineyella antarctica]|uniref:PH domain-containing protein n=1 Tax=Raineyella antarctica TaxID=1577474 RepID=A0A1G6HCG9_9ACTN|nr:PH domain-containing protein [Raineyella antarctica]SDB91891.1 PH domain-containing protein [Raineyella antarctica]
MSTLLRVRSRAMLITGSIVSALVLGSPIVTWIALPGEIRKLAVGVDLVMIGFILLAIVATVMLLATSSVSADEEGLTIVNGPVRHRYAWHEIVNIHFREGDPWAYVSTFRSDRDGDPERRMVMAIQAPDGDRARLQAARLRQIWMSHRL